MGNVIVLETTEHMNNGVRVADVGQKLVAQPLAFRGTFHQSGDIDDLDGGGNHRLGLSISASRMSRSSGTVMTPTLGSIVQKEIRRLRLGVGQAVRKSIYPRWAAPRYRIVKPLNIFRF